MPTSSSAATLEKKKSLRVHSQVRITDKCEAPKRPSGDFLTIESALPPRQAGVHTRKLYKRSHSTLNPGSLGGGIHYQATGAVVSDAVNLETKTDGSVHISRSQLDKDSNPDRISLDKRGLTTFPIIDGEIRLRLLSLQHNLITNLEGAKSQKFPYLVFLDIYDNQLENMTNLSALENLRVLLLGKNRIRKIEGLSTLLKIEVLDLHGNQITQVGGLSTLTELKVLNLAGNQIRYIGTTDFLNLNSLQELNLRRNRLRKLLGFGETPNLTKLFVSSNDLQTVEDMSSLARSANLKEISIDNNPVFLSGDCASFLASYLPQLIKLNCMQVTEQVRKAAMAWRRNKESTNSAFMDLTSEVCLNVRREEVISNARTNWELLRSQTKCLTSKTKIANSSKTSLNLDCDLILTSFGKVQKRSIKGAHCITNIVNRMPLNANFKATKRLLRSSSQDTDNSSSNTSTSNEFIRLPPILLPIIKKMEQKPMEFSQCLKFSGSLSSIGPNVDSSVSSLDDHESSRNSSTSSSDTEAENKDVEDKNEPLGLIASSEDAKNNPAETSSSASAISDLVTSQNHGNLKNMASTSTTTSTSSNSNKESAGKTGNRRNIKSAFVGIGHNSKLQQPHTRAVTAKSKNKQQSPQNAIKDREQGGDYLIEISGRFLNVYGQCALRFIDRPWNNTKAQDVTSVRFNYVNFNGICGVLNKLKQRFPNIENFHFKETNIQFLAQLNALAEVQGLQSLEIDPEGNPMIIAKNWRSYAIFRLSHWGLSTINGAEITEEELKKANEEYQSLADLVLWSLPDALLQPLLARLRLDVTYGVSAKNAKNAKKWLLKAEPELKSVVSKEALQWKKSATAQEDLVLRQRAKQHISQLLEELGNSVKKLRLLDTKWPGILHELIRNALLDYSQLDMYMKQKMLGLK